MRRRRLEGIGAENRTGDGAYEERPLLRTLALDQISATTEMGHSCAVADKPVPAGTHLDKTGHCCKAQLSTREVHVCSTLSCLKDRAERLQLFHCKKASPQGKTVSQPLPEGLPPEAMSSFRDLQSAEGNCRTLVQSPHRLRWNLMLDLQERKRNEGSKEREAGKERIYISGGKERGGTFTSHQSHTPYGEPIPHPTGIFWKQKRH